MTNCRDISKDINEKKTKFQVEIDFEGFQSDREDAIKLLEKILNETSQNFWIGNLIRILKKG